MCKSSPALPPPWSPLLSRSLFLPLVLLVTLLSNILKRTGKHDFQTRTNFDCTRIFFYESRRWVIDGWLHNIDCCIWLKYFFCRISSFENDWKTDLKMHKARICCNSQRNNIPQYSWMWPPKTTNRIKDKKLRLNHHSMKVSNKEICIRSYLVDGWLGEIDWYGQ